MFAGCIIPPSLSADTADAGANSPPAITSVRAVAELPEFSTVTFEKSDNTQLIVTVYDTDIDDTLYCRAFVDYKPDDPKPPRASTETAGTTVQRTCTMSASALCQSADIGAPEKLMQIFVFDRQILDGENPQFQAMRPGGLSASRVYFLKCVEMQAP